MPSRAKDFKRAQRSEEIADPQKADSESHEIALVDHTSGQSVGIQSGPDAVEIALGDAIQKAAAAGAFEVLPRLVAELERLLRRRLDLDDWQ